MEMFMFIKGGGFIQNMWVYDRKSIRNKIESKIFKCDQRINLYFYKLVVREKNEYE